MAGIPYTFASLPGGSYPATYLDLNFAYVGSTLNFIPSPSGTNTIVGNALIAPTSYWVGQSFSWLQPTTNTGASTLNVNGKGAGAIQQNGSALSGGEMIGGALQTVVVSSISPLTFQLMSPIPPTALPAVPNMQAFTSSGTYTPSSGMRAAAVLVVGGGGGGGTADSTNGGSGGGGGGAALGIFSKATIGSSQTVTVAASVSATVNGNSSSFGAICSATGGTGGTTNGTGSAGGTGTGGTINLTGGTSEGSRGGTGGGPTGGDGGSAPFIGVSTMGPGNTSGAGRNGIPNTGGGGSGGTAASGVGGTGASGIVIIVELF